MCPDRCKQQPGKQQPSDREISFGSILGLYGMLVEEAHHGLHLRGQVVKHSKSQPFLCRGVPHDRATTPLACAAEHMPRPSDKPLPARSHTALSQQQSMPPSNPTSCSQHAQAPRISLYHSGASR